MNHFINNMAFADFQPKIQKILWKKLTILILLRRIILHKKSPKRLKEKKQNLLFLNLIENMEILTKEKSNTKKEEVFSLPLF